MGQEYSLEMKRAMTDDLAVKLDFLGGDIDFSRFPLQILEWDADELVFTVFFYPAETRRKGQAFCEVTKFSLIDSESLEKISEGLKENAHILIDFQESDTCSVPSFEEYAYDFGAVNMLDGQKPPQKNLLELLESFENSGKLSRIEE